MCGAIYVEHWSTRKILPMRSGVPTVLRLVAPPSVLALPSSASPKHSYAIPPFPYQADRANSLEVARWGTTCRRPGLSDESASRPAARRAHWFAAQGAAGSSAIARSPRVSGPVSWARHEGLGRAVRCDSNPGSDKRKRERLAESRGRRSRSYRRRDDKRLRACWA